MSEKRLPDNTFEATLRKTVVTRLWWTLWITKKRAVRAVRVSFKKGSAFRESLRLPNGGYFDPLVEMMISDAIIEAVYDVMEFEYDDLYVENVGLAVDLEALGSELDAMMDEPEVTEDEREPAAPSTYEGGEIASEESVEETTEDSPAEDTSGSNSYDTGSDFDSGGSDSGGGFDD